MPLDLMNLPYSNWKIIKSGGSYAIFTSELLVQSMLDCSFRRSPTKSSHIVIQNVLKPQVPFRRRLEGRWFPVETTKNMAGKHQFPKGKHMGKCGQIWAIMENHP